MITLVLYFLAKDVVREGLNAPKVNMDRIIAQIDREGPDNPPGSNSSATPAMTEQQKKARQAQIDKAVADEKANIDAGIKADQKKQWADLKAKSAADEAAAKAARNAGGNAGGNAGSANDTLHDNTAAGIAKRGGITAGSQVVTTINPVAGAVYDYFSESW